MKKITFLLTFFIFFLFNCKQIYAAKGDPTGTFNYSDKDACDVRTVEANNRGAYTYDINYIGSDSDATLGNYLEIRGWGLLNSRNGSEKIDNIAPKMSLTLEAFNAETKRDDNGKLLIDKDKDKTFKLSATYNNILDKYNVDSQYVTYYYKNANSTPRDYTEFFYTSTSCSMPYRYYSGSGRSSTATGGFYDNPQRTGREYGGALCPKSDRNYLYINLNFVFKIPFSEIDKLIADSGDANVVYFRLGIATTSSDTVYGNPITTTGRSQSCIPITFTKTMSKALNTALKNNLKGKLTVGDAEDDTNSVSIMVQDAHPRVDNKFRGAWACRNGSRLVKGNYGCVDNASWQPVTLYQWQCKPNGYDSKGRCIDANGEYEIQDEELIDDGKTYLEGLSSSTSFRLYQVRLKLADNDNTKVVSASSGGLTAYIPALWVKPTTVDEGTYVVVTQVCATNTACDSKADLGEGTKCPAVNNTKAPSTEENDCCDDICKKDSGNEGTYYCTKICKIPTSCSANTACDSKSDLNTKNTKCPAVNNPNTPSTKTEDDCCTEICKIGSGNEGTYYCTDICKLPPPVVKDCDAISDPQEKYCCLYPGEAVCDTYDDDDDDDDYSDSREDKCSNTIVDDTFKYPLDGYGDNAFENNACKISCEEIVKVTFQPNQSLRAGMGFSYPINVNGTRYCTAEYKNDYWKNELISAGNNANTQYGIMETAIKKAATDDNKCGNPKATDAGNVCSGGETLTGDGQCKKSIGFTSCPDYHIQYELSDTTTSCSADGASCDCTTTTKTRTVTSEKSVTDPATGKKTLVKTYSDWSTSTNDFTATRCFGSYENGSCYSYRSACEARSSWGTLDGRSTCVKTMCSRNTSVYFDDAQIPIKQSIATAQNARNAYTAAVNRFTQLLTDRSTCDSYSTSNSYQGASKVNVSYDETGGSTQVSTQSGYSITNTTASGSTSFGARTPKSYDIKEAKDKPFSITSDGANSGTIGSFSATYKDYVDKPNVTYYDFWNEKSTASNKLEFSINYFVQRYTGDLNTTSKNGYDPGGRLVYTDFYQISKTQKFDLNLSNIGPNLPNSHNSSINLNPFTCSYSVSNMIFPPKGDPNYDKYGSVAFTFRQISLTDPFPNRDARENWFGYEYLITSKGYEVYNTRTPRYQYYLDPSHMQTIRIYNDTHNYGDYDIDNPYNSSFLDNVVRNW